MLDRRRMTDPFDEKLAETIKIQNELSKAAR